MDDVTYTGRTVDITPTWSALVRPMCAVLENPSKKPEVMNAKRTMRAEIAKMALAADRYNEYVTALRAEDGEDHS